MLPKEIYTHLLDAITTLKILEVLEAKQEMEFYHDQVCLEPNHHRYLLIHHFFISGPLTSPAKTTLFVVVNVSHATLD